MYGNRFIRDYGESAPEAWCNVIGALKDHELKGGLKKLLDLGSGSPPTLPQFIKACRNANEHEGAERNHSPYVLPKPEYLEKFHAHGEKCLFAYLWDRNGVSEAALKAMIQAKNRLVDSFRTISAEEEVTGAEIKRAMFAAFDKCWQPMPEKEAERHRESFIRTGFAAGFSQQ